MFSNKIGKQLGLVTFCLFFFFFLIYSKIYLSSRSEFNTAEIALSNEDYLSAMTHYERAVLWYLPIGGYAERSAERLWEIAVIMEEIDKKQALKAYRLLRSAFIASRSFYTPGKSWIDRSDQKIAGLMAEEPDYSEEDRNKSIEQKTEEALAILKQPIKPDPLWSVVLEIGFFGWVAGALLFIFRAFHSGQQMIIKRGLFWGGIVIFFYALWILGMMKA